VHSKAYIEGTGAVTPQPVSDPAVFLPEIRNTEGTSLRCIEPNYKEYVAGDMVRRMSRLIKMGIASAKMALGNDTPDAIITGTGLGCVEDTEKFLTTLIRNREEFLTPTSFIQSTHNTVSAQIALLLKCHAYNFTYVHRALSFESALLDTLLQLYRNPEHRILLGGSDELTPNTLQILTRLGQVRRKPLLNLDLLNQPGRGTIAGEGSVFFNVTGKPTPRTKAVISGLRMVFHPSSPSQIRDAAGELLADNHLTPGMIDLLLTGRNGDTGQDAPYHLAGQLLPATTPVAAFKPLCGEYFTASAFGVWLAVQILQHQSVPEPLLLKPAGNRPFQHILLYNHFMNQEHALILINRV